MDETATKSENEQKKPSKIDLKRAAQYEERVRRLVNKGMTRQKAIEAIAEEDYRNMPIEKKFTRFQSAIIQALQKMAQDIVGLRHNDGVIADVIDLNSKAMTRCLQKAGVSVEQQSDIIKSVEAEMAEERQKRIEEAKKKAESKSDEKIVRELSIAESQDVASIAALNEAAQAISPPSEATTFGG